MVRHGAFQFNVRPMSRLDYVMALVLIMSAEYLRRLCTKFMHRTIPYSALTKRLFLSTLRHSKHILRVVTHSKMKKKGIHTSKMSS